MAGRFVYGLAMRPTRPCFALATVIAMAPAAGGCAGSRPTAAEAPAQKARVLRLHGAASVVDSLVAPHAAAVERATGVKLSVDRSNAGKGLKDLVEGKCDLALASASLEATVAAARTAGLAAPAPDLRLHVAATSEVVFVVHPSNPVRRLTLEQVREIHTGKIASWKELGGPDLPIAVVTDAAASATRGLVKQVVLGGAEYASAARAMPAVAEVNEEVARNPAAIGGLGREFVDPARVAVVETKKIERPLAFVSVGEPGADAARVIEAFRAAAKH
jgi:phosphate transport system substrate-binding protein